MDNIYDTIIIGAGPAGLTAAIYTLRALKKTLVLEALTYGGQIINSEKIDNYPAEAHISGIDFATKLYHQVCELGGEIVFQKVTDIKDEKEFKEIITDEKIYRTKTIILATGTKNRKLLLKNESDFVGKGISYCATCDGAFYKNKSVAIQGGGATAVEDAIYLSDIAKKVYLIHRNCEFRADETLIKQMKKKNNIKLIMNSNVTKLFGKENLEEIEITDNTGKTKRLNISGLFIAIGRVPQNDYLENLLKLNKEGYIITDENCHTNIAGIFAAGDNREKKLRQLVTATADGAIAATEAIKYINNK